MSTTGERFVAAIAAHDRAALQDVLAEDVDFKGLTPGRFWEASSPGEVEDVVLGHWFEESDHIDEVQAVTTDTVADTERVGYRFHITNGDGPHVVEQQLYYRADGERISYARIVCSGYRPD